MLKISAISLVLRTREITDIFNTFDEIYLVFTSKKSKYPLYIKVDIASSNVACAAVLFVSVVIE